MKVKKVNDNIVINMYDNGYMVEINGQDEDGNYAVDRVICTTAEEVHKLVATVFNMPRNE